MRSNFFIAFKLLNVLNLFWPKYVLIFLNHVKYKKSCMIIMIRIFFFFLLTLSIINGSRMTLLCYLGNYV